MISGKIERIKAHLQKCSKRMAGETQSVNNESELMEKLDGQRLGQPQIPTICYVIQDQR